MSNIGKWYTFTEYYNEEGVQITKKEALKNYIISETKKITKINGNTATRTICKICRRNRQLKLEI